MFSFILSECLFILFLIIEILLLSFLWTWYWWIRYGFWVMFMWVGLWIDKTQLYRVSINYVHGLLNFRNGYYVYLFYDILIDLNTCHLVWSIIQELLGLTISRIPGNRNWFFFLNKLVHLLLCFKVLLIYFTIACPSSSIWLYPSRVHRHPWKVSS